MTTHEEFKELRRRAAEDFNSEDAAFAFRMALTCCPELDTMETGAVLSDLDAAETDAFNDAVEVLKGIIDYEFGGRDLLTTLAIEDSICPVHFCDWASCFDDADPDCDQVRSIYPMSHDT